MSHQNKDGLLLYSGGMDSTTLLYVYKDRIAEAIFFDYGSKHNSKEYEMARRNCANLKITLNLLALDFSFVQGCSLLGDGNIPKKDYSVETLQSTVVPFRNAIMITHATSLAIAKGLKTIWIATHTGDHAVYADCRLNFLEGMQSAVHWGSSNDPNDACTLKFPFCDMTKREIAEKGFVANTPFELSWSCYEGGEKHCGVCSTCRERKEALKGFDPTEYMNNSNNA